MSSIKRINFSPKSEAENGYSTVVKAGPFYFIGGISAADPETDTFEHPDDPVEQTRTVYHTRISGILQELGLKPSNIVEETVFLRSWDRADEVIATRKEFYADTPGELPSAAAVQVLEFADPSLLFEVKLTAYAGD